MKFCCWLHRNLQEPIQAFDCDRGRRLKPALWILYRLKLRQLPPQQGHLQVAIVLCSGLMLILQTPEISYSTMPTARDHWEEHAVGRRDTQQKIEDSAPASPIILLVQSKSAAMLFGRDAINS